MQNDWRVIIQWLGETLCNTTGCCKLTGELIFRRVHLKRDCVTGSLLALTKYGYTYFAVSFRLSTGTGNWVTSNQKETSLRPPVRPSPWFNIKMASYQYRNSNCGDMTIVRSSYLHNGVSYTGKMTTLYWIRAQDSNLCVWGNIAENVWTIFIPI